MNEHIELVKKFLANDDSVTEAELKANKNDARAAWAARAAVDCDAAEAAYWAALWAFRAAYWADNLGDEAAAIKEYERLTKCCLLGCRRRIKS